MYLTELEMRLRQTGSENYRKEAISTLERWRDELGQQLAVAHDASTFRDSLLLRDGCSAALAVIEKLSS